jgi:serine protease Do
MAGVHPLTSFAQPPRTANPDGPVAVAAIEQTLVEVIARAEPSVVAVSRSSPPREAVIVERSLGDAFNDLRAGEAAPEAAATVGAGVIIDRAGLILTQYLSVREGDQHMVTTVEGRRYRATIRGADPRSGLAVLAIDEKAGPPEQTENIDNKPSPGSFPAIRHGDAATLRKGQFVVAIGNPFAIAADGQPTASWGIVTNLSRKAPAGTNFNDAPGPAGDYRTTLYHYRCPAWVECGRRGARQHARRTGGHHDNGIDDCRA